MKIISENGKLFGKVNIIDVIIIAFMLVIVPWFFYTYEVLGKRPSIVPHTWIKVEAVTFSVPELANTIREGNTMRLEDGTIYGRIIKIVDRHTEYDIERLKWAIAIEKPDYLRRVPIFMEMELLCTKSGKYETWYFNREPLYIGIDFPFNFGTDKYRIFCFVLKIIEE